MIADEKGVVGRDDVAIKDREWRFKLWRSAGQTDHRTLLRIFDKRPFAIFERQRYRGCKCAQREGRHSRTERRNGGPGILYEAAPVYHRVSPFRLAAAR